MCAAAMALVEALEKADAMANVAALVTDDVEVDVEAEEEAAAACAEASCAKSNLNFSWKLSFRNFSSIGLCGGEARRAAEWAADTCENADFSL